MIAFATYLGSLVGMTLLALLIACVGSMVTMVLFDLFVTSPDPEQARNVYNGGK
jgi:hypothetical protein